MGSVTPPCELEAKLEDEVPQVTMNQGRGRGDWRVEKIEVTLGGEMEISRAEVAKRLDALLTPIQVN
jgi:hypothetical protein